MRSGPTGLRSGHAPGWRLTGRLLVAAAAWQGAAFAQAAPAPGAPTAQAPAPLPPRSAAATSGNEGEAPSGDTAKPAGASSDVERRLRELELANRHLRDEVDQLKEDQKFTEQRVNGLFSRTKINGYVDFGAFYVQGNGSGIRNDAGNFAFPEYANINPGGAWIFYGDPLATTINSRGDIADNGGSRAIAFNPIGNGGAASFIVNALTLTLFQGIGDQVTVNGMVDFIPRGRSPSDPIGKDIGDYIEAKLAYAEWRVPTKGWDLSLFAGKFDSVLGIEYRTQESPDRIGITPSLICRYTCGYPLGLKARAQFLDQRLNVAVEVIDGSNQIENFPFYDQIDTHSMKTVAGRVGFRVPIGGEGLEVGVSGAYGPEANQPTAPSTQSSDSIAQYHFGADVKLQWRALDVRGEFVMGKANGQDSPGEPCGAIPCIHYAGAYGQVGYRVTNWFMPYARVDGRNALHENAPNFIYISQLARGTLGTHFEFGTSVIVKAEYTVIRELGRSPQIPDNVATSSMVVKF